MNIPIFFPPPPNYNPKQIFRYLISYSSIVALKIFIEFNYKVNKSKVEKSRSLGGFPTVEKNWI